MAPANTNSGGFIAESVAGKTAMPKTEEVEVSVVFIATDPNFNQEFYVMGGAASKIVGSTW